MSGTLYLLPCPIADGSLAAALPPMVMEIGRRIDRFLVEDAKSARAFLKELGHPKPMRDVAIVEIGHQPRTEDLDGWLAPLAEGHDVAVISEAGCPAIADPGGTIVAAAHARGFRVRPLVGPSSILLALMGSGLEGQRFRFHGYLPIAAEARTAALKSLERDSKSRNETQVFIETPYRSASMFDAMLTCCAPSTRLAIAIDLTGEDEFLAMRSIQLWKQSSAERHPPFERRPAVFCLLA
jgi:16S rRNA (cytidine1402-2'-O)-methyltransferase